MEAILKIGRYIITLINLFSALLTIIMSYKKATETYFYMVCIIILVLSSVTIYVCLISAYSKLYTLRILVHRGRVATINYITYLDFLEYRFHRKYDNNPKINDIIVTNSEFKFYIHNIYNNTDYVDVDYNHKFHLIKHGGEFDALILHSNGTLVREIDKNQIKQGIFIIYLHNFYLINPQLFTGDISNIKNQIIDRVQCALPSMKEDKEILEFHYRINNEFNIKEDEIFVVYPYNYGKKFNKTAKFTLLFDESYCADIQLLTLPYNYIVGGGIKRIAQFQTADYKMYQCSIKSLKSKNIYFISIRKTIY